MTPLRCEPFGVTLSGDPVERYVLDNGRLELSVLTWGATVQSLLVPDGGSEPAYVVLGFDQLAGYLGDHPYLGAVIGRYANRIARGRFSLDGVDYQIPPNERGNALHGGPEGVRHQQRLPRGPPGQHGQLKMTVVEYMTLDRVAGLRHAEGRAPQRRHCRRL